MSLQAGAIYAVLRAIEGAFNLQELRRKNRLSFLQPERLPDMNADIKAYSAQQDLNDREICELLTAEIDKRLPEAQSKIWHRHPVWFLEGNPTVGFSKLKGGIRLMFWSGADFSEDVLARSSRGIFPGVL
jgi:hypothetical protein